MLLGGANISRENALLPLCAWREVAILHKVKVLARTCPWGGLSERVCFCSAIRAVKSLFCQNRPFGWRRFVAFFPVCSHAFVGHLYRNLRAQMLQDLGRCMFVVWCV